MRLFFFLFVLFHSCEYAPTSTDKNPYPDELELVVSSPTQFPATEYDSVVLFSINREYYNLDDVDSLQQEVMTARHMNGLAFIDSFGVPTSKYFIRHKLSDHETTRLKALFHLPKNNGEIMRKMCLPVYRDVFVFYKKHRQVAQAQICLQCEQANLIPQSDDLSARFTTDVKWKELRSFIQKAKRS